jgi:hypothetical protein
LTLIWWFGYNDNMKNLMLKGMALMLAFGVFAPSLALADVSGLISKPACNLPGTHVTVSISGCSSKTTLEGKGGLATIIVNLFLYAAGIVAFIFIIIGGVRYMTATGDPSRIQSAKETLLYAIIGLILTFLAIPISGFIIQVATGKK